MGDIGKLLLALGAALCLAGAGAWLLGRAGLRALPGDIVHESGGARIYFPIVTCLLLSLLLTLALWAWQWLRR